MKEPYFVCELIKKLESEMLNLIEQLKRYERNKWIRQPYIRFVSAERPNLPSTEWQFDENIVLEDESAGTIVLDILKNGKIWGIEFVNQIPHS